MRLIENLPRADLTPLEEAESYQQRLAAAIEEGKLLTAASSWLKQIGKHEKYVRSIRLRLLDAIPPVKRGAS
jgi:ParB-like chromosome segregation protein Spo0J